MQKIVIGDILDKIDFTSKKTRIIHIKENKILVNIYAGNYMLPGGKIDNDETTIEAIKREIKEELGNTLIEDKLIPFKNIINNAAKYPSKHTINRINKTIDTTYYIYEGPIDLELERHLSKSEKAHNFTLKYIDIAELLSILNTNVFDEKQQVFANELIIIIKEILKYYKTIDLHTHTIYSDGEHSPNKVIEKAKNNNIRVVAITDHDTILGLKKIDFDLFKDILIIPGIELSIKRPHGRMHILGLDIDFNNKALNKKLDDIKNNCINNVKNIINYLLTKGIYMNPDDINSIFTKIGNIGRPDIAKLLVKEGYASSIQDAFDKYLVEAFNKTRKESKGLTYEEAIDLILKANGIPVLAHPNTLELNNDEFEELLQDMIKKGLKAIETNHSNMTYEEMEYYMSIAKKYNLAYSVGSDYHGEHIKPDIKLGSGKNNINKITASVLNLTNKKSR